MQYRPLGRSDLRVSHIGLGTMTWGEQNDEAQAHEQLDAALAAGVNFVDTAEMYPVAPRAETYGRTDKIIGSWLARTARRPDIILASQVIGPGPVSYVRGRPRLDRESVMARVGASLPRTRQTRLAP